jgi:hypothetical protein
MMTDIKIPSLDVESGLEVVGASCVTIWFEPLNWFDPDVPVKESQSCIASLGAGKTGGLSDSGILCKDKGS